MSGSPLSMALGSLSQRWAMKGLRTKLLFGFGGLLLVLLTVSTLANIALQRYSRWNQQILREDLSSVEAVQDMRNALVGVESEVRTWLRGTEPDANPDVVRYLEQFDHSLNVQKNSATLPLEPEATQRVAGLWEQYRQGVVVLLGTDPAPSDRQRAYDDKLVPLADSIREAAQDISRLNIAHIHDAEQHVDAIASAALLAMHVLTACGVAVTVLFALLIGRIILRPIRALTRCVQEVERGNLDLTVPIRSRDELGQLAAAFDAMAAQLREFRRIDHEKLIRTQRTTQLAVDSLPDGVVVINPQGGIELANETAQRLFDLRPGVHVSQVKSLPDGRLADLHRRGARDGRLPEVGGYAAAIKVRDAGQDRYFLPRAVPILDDASTTMRGVVPSLKGSVEPRQIGLSVVLVDVTDFRRLDELKSGLLSLVSHELKTPLTSLRMILPLLVDAKVGPVSPKQRELLVAAREDSDRLHQIVENLLDMGRLESGKGLMDVRSLAAEHLIEHSVQAFRGEYQEKGVILEVEHPGQDQDAMETQWGGAAIGTNDLSQPQPDDRTKTSAIADLSEQSPALHVMADETRINHVFANLLANALRYTPAGGHVRVALRDALDRVEFSVADSGSGIPRAHLHRVFEKFFRAPGQPGDSGSGLGLAIVKDIVEAHGGHVTVESVEGQGATFRFTLRKAGSAESAAGSSEPVIAAASAPRPSVVDRAALQTHAI